MIKTGHCALRLAIQPNDIETPWYHLQFHNSMQTQGPQYDVPTGRRDGRVSNIADANNMPQVRDPINVLKSKFTAVGLSDKDLVLLSGN
jgi:Peroxidase